MPLHISTYVASSFYKSTFLLDASFKMKKNIGKNMRNLAAKGELGNLASRIVAPFVGVSTLLAVTILRICMIIEPIIGLFADIGASIIYRNHMPLKNIPYRLITLIFGNPFRFIALTAIDTVKLGLGITIGATIVPDKMYKTLSYPFFSPKKGFSLGKNNYVS